MGDKGCGITLSQLGILLHHPHIFSTPAIKAELGPGGGTGRTGFLAPDLQARANKLSTPGCGHHLPRTYLSVLFTSHTATCERTITADWLLSQMQYLKVRDQSVPVLSHSSRGAVLHFEPHTP